MGQPSTAAVAELQNAMNSPNNDSWTKVYKYFTRTATGRQEMTYWMSVVVLPSWYVDTAFPQLNVDTRAALMFNHYGLTVTVHNGLPYINYHNTPECIMDRFRQVTRLQGVVYDFLST